MPFLVIAGIVAGIFVLPGVVAAICHFLTKRDTLSTVVGTLSIALVLCLSVVDWGFNMDVDDPSPGNVLIGGLLFLLVPTPIALFASHKTVNFLSSRDR